MLTAGMMFRPHTSHYLLASFLSVGSLAQHKTHRFCHLALTKYHVVLQIHSTHRSIAVCPHILQLDRFSFYLLIVIRLPNAVCPRFLHS